MGSLDDQLAQLRRRMAVLQPPPPPRSVIEDWTEGQVVSNDHGTHFQSERLFASYKPHGSADVGALAELPHDFLDTLSEQQIPNCHPERWAFLDTETTGLAGGTGTYAFLIGVGRITQDGFRVRQFFMREYSEERSLLSALEAHLNEFDVLITYNGKTYDQPLLETRYRMTRSKPPFARMSHLDLLHGARRLWKLRLESCKLTHLEQEILGVERDGDVPGHLIPEIYFGYLRSKEASKLLPIFHHNAMDILTLACLTAIVPGAFKDTLMVKRGEELAGIARWLLAEGENEKALEVLNRAVKAGLPDRLLFRALWDIASLEKKARRWCEAVAGFTELAGCRNDYRVCALEELAKYYEHEERNAVVALEFTRQALGYATSAGLDRRRERLERKTRTTLFRSSSDRAGAGPR
jgi:uncharacterized protein YprB with RNaseH-like and TPR domain